MWSADLNSRGRAQSPGAQHDDAPLRRKGRLHLVYFALAAFDILAISCTLLLSHNIMTAYEKAVLTSRVWAMHVSEIAVLGDLARQTNAPGNDVFATGDVKQERARRDTALGRFDAHWEQLHRDVHKSASGEDRAVFVKALGSIRASMGEMVGAADEIFASIEAGDEGRAGAQMASMDRTYGQLTRSILEAVNEVQAIQMANLERQVNVAKQLRALESVIGGLIVIIVISVAIYGGYIASVMRRTEDRHDLMITKLNATQTALRFYADNVAHELRSPLNKILVGSEVTLTRSRTVEEYQEALVSNIEECQRLSRIVESLLFMAKAEHVTGEIDRQPVRIARELQLLESAYQESASEVGVRLTHNCHEETVFPVDRVLFQRAVANLVSNAIAHTGASGAVSVEVYLANGDLVVEVADTGEGIPADAQERVFDRFFRVDQARSSTSGRVGLGLPITKSIVELHGGSISLSSEVGLGTRITLTFPPARTPAGVDGVGA